MIRSEQSIQNAAWQKLTKNKAAVFGMFIIAAATLLAIFAYLIAPDASPNANRMIVEIGGLKPGTSQLFMREEKEGPIKTAGFFQRLLYGQRKHTCSFR